MTTMPIVETDFLKNTSTCLTLWQRAYLTICPSSPGIGLMQCSKNSLSVRWICLPGEGREKGRRSASGGPGPGAPPNGGPSHLREGQDQQLLFETLRLFRMERT